MFTILKLFSQLPSTPLYKICNSRQAWKFAILKVATILRFGVNCVYTFTTEAFMRTLICLCLLFTHSLSGDFFSTLLNSQPNANQFLVYSLANGCKTGKTGCDTKLLCKVDDMEKDLSDSVLSNTPQASRVVTFDIKGLPQGQNYWLYSLNLYNELEPLHYFKSDDQGRLVAVDNPKAKAPLPEGAPLSELKIVASEDKIRVSEPISYVLVSDNGKTVVSQRVIPRPLEVTGTGGTRVAIEMMSQASFRAVFKGFKPYEICMVSSTSEKGATPSTVYTMSKAGDGEISLTPEVIGKKYGKAKLRFTRLFADKEVLSLDYDWGVPPS